MNPILKSILLVFFGGGLGSVVRYVIHYAVGSVHPGYFPYGTLVVNILACVVLGAVVGLADHRHLLSMDARLFWAVGFCGGFSTFSTFSIETISMIQTGFTVSALIYIAASVLLCLAAVFGGLYAGQNF